MRAPDPVVSSAAATATRGLRDGQGPAVTGETLLRDSPTSGGIEEHGVLHMAKRSEGYGFVSLAESVIDYIAAHFQRA